MKRSALLTAVDQRLGTRALVWCGLRAEDAEPIADIPQFEAAYGIIAAYRNQHFVDTLAFEDLVGRRHDMETWDIEDHLEDGPVHEFRMRLLSSLAGDSALLPYRSSNFLSSVWFSRIDNCLNLGRFGGLQAAFEHKPWIESAVTQLGLAAVPWVYLADIEQMSLVFEPFDSPLVVRRSRTSGGEGFAICESVEDVRAAWPHQGDGLASVTPFLEGAIPINVGATVWNDGVTVHHPSVQLIGIPECTDRPFGYVGNDFYAVNQLDRSTIDEIEAATIAVGEWLGRRGYLGTLGVDFMIHQGRPLFTEINPRFQGSTRASCEFDIASDESCLMIEHIAATLGIDCPSAPRLRDLVSEAPSHATIVAHWSGCDGAAIDLDGAIRDLELMSDYVACEVRLPKGVAIDSGGVLARVTVGRSVTDSGLDLDPKWREAMSGLSSGGGASDSHVPNWQRDEDSSINHE